MAAGHMLCSGGMPVPVELPRMGSHSPVFEEDLHGAGGEAHINLLFYKLIGNAVVVSLDIDVVIDIDSGLFPFGILVRCAGQRLEGGPVDCLEELPAGAVHLLELAVVQLGELLSNGLIQLPQAEEALVSQGGGDPSLRDQDRRFHLGLVPGFSGPCGDDHSRVMPCHVMVGGIYIGFVAAGSGDPAFEIIRDDDLGDAAKKGKRLRMGGDPAREVLPEARFDKRIVARPQGGNEQIRIPGLARSRVHNRDRLAGIIDEEFFSGPVCLPQARVEPGRPLPVMMAELAILITPGVGLSVFEPQEPQGYPLAGKLLVDVFHTVEGLVFSKRPLLWNEKEPLELGVIDIRRKGPCQSRPLGPLQVAPDGAPGDIAAHGDLCIGKVLFPLQT